MKDVREVAIHIKVTAEEKRILTEKAKQNGMALGTYLRFLGMKA